MKVLLISNMYPSNSKPYSGIFVKRQFEGLKRIINENDTLHLFAMKRRFTGPFGGLLKYTKAFIQFIPYLFKHYDIVHLHYFYPLGIFVYIYKLFHPKSKFVVTFHGSDVITDINGKIKLHIFKKVAKKIDCTIPVGQFVHEKANEKLGELRSIILNVGVNTEIFEKIQDERKIYDIIFIGSFIKRKGIDLLISALNEYQEHRKKLCFVGSGPYYDDIMELKLKKIHDIYIFQNIDQKEICRLLNQTRYLILPSRIEGFPTVIMEAMTCGVPVLCSDIPQMQEQVINNMNGFLFKNDSVDSIVTTLQLIDKIDREKYNLLSANALNTFNESKLDIVCTKLYQIYNTL